MQIETLQLFCDVVRLRSFSRSAEANGVTQSMASQAVHSLEERLGASLIDRSERPWTLTSEGHVFYSGCRDLIERYRQLEAKVKGLHEEVSSVVRVAAIYSVGLRHMSEYVRKFSALDPQAKIHLEYLHPNRVYETVLNDETDLGIVSFPQANRELAVIPWKLEPMVLACDPSHPLARRKEIPPSQIAGERLVGFDKDLAMRAEIERFLGKHNAEVEVVLEFDNIESIKRAVEIGSGIAILPRPTMDREIRNGTLAAVPFKTRDFSRPLGIIHRRDKEFSSHAARFIDLLQSKKRPEPSKTVAAA